MREPDIITLNRKLTGAILELPGNPTLSTAAGRSIARTFDVSPRTGKRLFHGSLAVTAAVTMGRGLPGKAQVAIGLLAYLFLESFDPSR